MCYNGQMKKAAFLNLMVLASLALIFGVVSFVWSSGADLMVFEKETESDFPLNQEVQSTEMMNFQRNGRDQLLVFPGSTFTANWDESTQDLNLNLESGAALMAAVAGDFTGSISTPYARIGSDHGIFYVQIEEDGVGLNVMSLEQSSLISFLDKKGKVLNEIALLESQKLNLPASKVTDLLGRLRLTKLMKEFPSYDLKEADLSNAVKEAHEKIQEDYQGKSLDFIQKVQSQGEFGPGNSWYASFESALTVLPHAKARLKTEEENSALTYALSALLVKKNQQEAEKWIKEWNPALQKKEVLTQMHAELFFVLPGDELYPLKAEIASTLFSENEPLLSLHRKLQEIEALIKRGSLVEAQEAHSVYQAEFRVVLKKGVLDQAKFLPSLHRERIELEHVLKQGDVFYRLDAIQLLSEIESKILLLSGSSVDLDEERQAFVQSKIAFLANLFQYVMSKDLDVKLAGPVAQELLFEAQNYLGSIKSEVAVKAYFQQKLEEADLTIKFMNSPEFRSYTDLKTGLAAYKEKEADLEALKSYVQSLRSGRPKEEGVATLSLEEAQAEVEKALKSNGIQFSGVESLGDSEFRLFHIQDGAASGELFDGNYDRETQLLYDIVTGDLRFSTGIQLKQFASVMKEAHQADLSAESEEAQTSSPEEQRSLTESVAIQTAIKSFESFGFKKDDLKLTVLDLESNLFSCELLLDSEILVSATFDLDEQRLSEISWEMDGQSNSLPDLPLENLETAIKLMAAQIQKN
jgi:hypothetical protein